VAIASLSLALVSNFTGGLGSYVAPVTWHQPDGDVSIANAVIAASDCGQLLGCWIQLPLVGVSAASGSGATNAMSAAVLRFVAAAGTGATLVVPGAPSTAYLVDGETVDPAGVLAPVIAAFVAHAVTASGEPIGAYVSGYRVQLRPRLLDTA